MRISDWSSDVCSSDLQSGRKLRTFGMEDERPAHAENPTEKASFEHDIVSGRSQTRLQCGCWRAGGCPVVLTEDEGREVNLARSEEHTSELQSLMRISYAVFCLK